MSLLRAIAVALRRRRKRVSRVFGPPVVQGVYGHTPLFYAIGAGHREVARMLIDAGADMDSEDKAGHTPLFFAIGSGQKVRHKTRCSAVHHASFDSFCHRLDLDAR